MDGQAITTGRGYSDTRSVRIEREDILYGFAALPSTPLRVLLLSAPLTGCILETAPKNKMDTSGQALLVAAQTLLTPQVRARCISKTEELKHSYVMVKSFEHLLSHKLDAIVTECAMMLQTGRNGDGNGAFPIDMQQACLRCFVESLVHEHIMKSLAKLWADEVARFAACCNAIKSSDASLPPPPPASAVSQHLSGLSTARCYTQKAELVQRLLDAILLSAGSASTGGSCGVISTDDLLPFIISFVCAHACDGLLLLHVMFCDCMQHTLLAQAEWSFTLSLFKSAVVYVAADSMGAAGLATGGSKVVASRKHSVTSLAAALGSSSSNSSNSVQQPQSVPPYRRSSLMPDASASSAASFSIGSSGSSSFCRPPAVILPDAHRQGVRDGVRIGGDGQTAGGADRQMLGSFLSSLIDDD